MRTYVQVGLAIVAMLAPAAANGSYRAGSDAAGSEAAAAGQSQLLEAWIGFGSLALVLGAVAVVLSVRRDRKLVRAHAPTDLS